MLSNQSTATGARQAESTRRYLWVAVSNTTAVSKTLRLSQKGVCTNAAWRIPLRSPGAGSGFEFMAALVIIYNILGLAYPGYLAKHAKKKSKSSHRKRFAAKKKATVSSQERKVLARLLVGLQPSSNPWRLALSSAACVKNSHMEKNTIGPLSLRYIQCPSYT